MSLSKFFATPTLLAVAVVSGLSSQAEAWNRLKLKCPQFTTVVYDRNDKSLEGSGEQKYLNATMEDMRKGDVIHVTVTATVKNSDVTVEVGERTGDAKDLLDRATTVFSTKVDQTGVAVQGLFKMKRDGDPEFCVVLSGNNFRLDATSIVAVYVGREQ